MAEGAVRGPIQTVKNDTAFWRLADEYGQWVGVASRDLLELGGASGIVKNRQAAATNRLHARRALGGLARHGSACSLLGCASTLSPSSSPSSSPSGLAAAQHGLLSEESEIVCGQWEPTKQGR